MTATTAAALAGLGCGQRHAERGAKIDVLEWPTPKVSYSLSPRFGKGASRSSA